jgi:nicotinic acid phosphoribosyltransferase
VASADRLTLVVVVEVPADGVEAFQRYEAAVLPLLEEHDGRLERRLRTEDGLSEVHVLSFGSRSAYQAYVADPARAAHRALLDGVELHQRLREVTDVA